MPARVVACSRESEAVGGQPIANIYVTVAATSSGAVRERSNPGTNFIGAV